MSLTAEQLEERRAYLGGTDAAALAGVNPPGWAQPIDVYREKVGLTEPRTTSTTMMSMGTLLEPVVADLFTTATGVKLRRWGKPVRSREYPWAGGHLDRWAADGGIFEAKWAMRKDGWGAGWVRGEDGLLIPPEGEALRVPLNYAVQVQHYLAVTDRPFAYLAVLLGWGDFRWFILERKAETIAWLMELEERFWRENVLAGVPPEPDGSASYGRHLRTLYGTDDGLEAVATPEQHELVGRLRLATRGVKDALRLEAEAQQRVMDSMGTTSKLVGPDFTISWSQNKPTLRVQWEALATELLGTSRLPLEVAEAIGAPEGVPWASLTKKRRAELIRAMARHLGLADTEPGARPFKPTFDADEEEASATP